MGWFASSMSSRQSTVDSRDISDEVDLVPRSCEVSFVLDICDSAQACLAWNHLGLICKVDVWDDLGGLGIKCCVESASIFSRELV